MSHHIFAVITALCLFIAVPVRATDTLIIDLDDGLTVGAGWGELTPERHDLRITVIAPPNRVFYNDTWAWDQTGSSWWDLESYGETTQVFVSYDAQEDEMGWIDCSGTVFDPNDPDPWLNGEYFSVKVSNVLWPCASCPVDEFGMPLNPDDCTYDMTCSLLEEGQIEVAQLCSVSTSVTIHHGMPGTLTILGAGGGLEVLNSDGTPFTSKYITGSGVFTEPLLLRTDATFTGQVALTARFLQDGADLDSQDTLIVMAGEAAEAEVQLISGLIPATPCRTLRQPYTEHPAARPFDSDEDAPTWASGKSIVLVRNSPVKVPLQAFVIKNGQTNPPGVENSVRWECQRADDDADALEQPPFPAGALTLSQPNNPGLQKDLFLDKVGSFWVRVYYDKNGNGSYDLCGESAKYWNVVVVAVAGMADLSTGSSANFSFDVINGSFFIDAARMNKQAITISTGDFEFPEPEQTSAMFLQGRIGLVGGGEDGKRGLDRVKAGWVHNAISDGEPVTYQDGVVTSYLANTDLDPEFDGEPRYWTDPQNPLRDSVMQIPLSEEKPLLDTGRTDGDPFLATSREVVEVAALGERRLVEAVDSPGTVHLTIHPKIAGSRIEDCGLELSFKGYVAVRTGTESAAIDEPGGNYYSSAVIRAWSLEAGCLVTWDGNNPITTAKSENAVSFIGDPVLYNNAVPMAGEVCPPRIVQRLVPRLAVE